MLTKAQLEGYLKELNTRRKKAEADLNAVIGAQQAVAQLIQLAQDNEVKAQEATDEDHKN